MQVVKQIVKFHVCIPEIASAFFVTVTPIVLDISRERPGKKKDTFILYDCLFVLFTCGISNFAYWRENNNH